LCLIPFFGDVEKTLSNRAAFTASNVETLAVPDISKLPESRMPETKKKEKRK